MSLIPVFATGVIFLIPGVVLLLIGFMNRKSKQHRVQVLAYVVEYSNWTRPHRVVFDYPLPNGQWTRQTRSASFMSDPTGQGKTGLAAWVKPGHPFHVYVNPANPHDVTLGAAGPGRVLAYVAMAFGAGLILMFLIVAARTLLL